MSTRVGIIGLGNMGSGMACNLQRHLAAQGSRLRVFDLDPAKVQTQVDNGAEACESAQDLITQVDVLFTSLPSAVQIDALAPQIFAQGTPALTWFETSTNDLAHWQALRDQAPSSMQLIDAPITGGYEGARDGTLTVLLGGEPEAIEPHRALLESISKKAQHMGPAGAGYITKLAQLHLNYLVALGMGEALMLGAKGGLDMSTLHQVLMNSCAQSYVVDAYTPRVLDGSYDPSFALGLARKDMALINELGQHLQVPLELGQQVLAAYDQATEQYGAEAPHLSVLRRIEDATNTPLRS